MIVLEALADFVLYVARVAASTAIGTFTVIAILKNWEGLL